MPLTIRLQKNFNYGKAGHTVYIKIQSQFELLHLLHSKLIGIDNLLGIINK